jgi:outer membrane protein assembly factor BamA
MCTPQELAGLGGDTQFIKVGAMFAAAASLHRFANDTGFENPLSKTMWERQTKGILNYSNPGQDILSRWGLGWLQNRSTSQSSYTFADRLSAWMSGGVTLNADISAGVGKSFDTAPTRADGSLGLLDRYYILGHRFRGYDALGPRAAPVEFGTMHGDALGGNIFAAVSARLLLPPPLPSIRLANAGVRSQLFFSSAVLAAWADRHKLIDLNTLKDMPSSAAGVGFVIPLSNAACVEANYALWHRGAATDVKSSFRLQLTL